MTRPDMTPNPIITTSDITSTAKDRRLRIGDLAEVDWGAWSTRFVLFTGKGGVGKTTIAGLIAVELARRGYPVHLSSTDPAGHAAATAADLSSLTTSAIDPDAATRDYVQECMRSGSRKGLDQAHLDLLAEDLRSPCSQEVAVFQAFHRLLGRASDEFVVIDTAPTGHTLLLLDVTGAYHRQAMEGVAKQSGRVITPLMRLQDPAYSKGRHRCARRDDSVRSRKPPNFKTTFDEPASSLTAGSSTRPWPIPARRTRYSHPAPRSNVPTSPASPHSQCVNGRCLGTPTSGPASERDRSDSLPYVVTRRAARRDHRLRARVGSPWTQLVPGNVCDRVYADLRTSARQLIASSAATSDQWGK